ncbi:hypothetical protein HKCCE2091_13735 [Rhodobacterales bacterium HKCCE2091]|nr:hypothetical protein [Rhodobacterales bacterium HKCCE2091]
MSQLPHIAALALLLVLAGCNSEKRDFVAACSEGDLTGEECQCAYDLAGEELSPSDRDSFVTAVIEGSDAAAFFDGAAPGQSIFTGINLVGFLIQVQRQCIGG